MELSLRVALRNSERTFQINGLPQVHPGGITSKPLRNINVRVLFAVHIACQNGEMEWAKKRRPIELAAVVPAGDLVYPPSDVTDCCKTHCKLPTYRELPTTLCRGIVQRAVWHVAALEVSLDYVDRLPRFTRAHGSTPNRN